MDREQILEELKNWLNSWTACGNEDVEVFANDTLAYIDELEEEYE